MVSLDEQIRLLKIQVKDLELCLNQESTSLYQITEHQKLVNDGFDLTRIKMSVDYYTWKVDLYVSMLNSLESLKQKMEIDYDFFVAVMHKDDFAKFIEFKSIDKRPRELLVKRYGNRKKAINRFKSH